MPSGFSQVFAAGVLFFCVTFFLCDRVVTFLVCSTSWVTSWCSCCWVSHWNWSIKGLKWEWFTSLACWQVRSTVTLHQGFVMPWTQIFGINSFWSCCVWAGPDCQKMSLMVKLIIFFLWFFPHRLFGQLHLWSSQWLGGGIWWSLRANRRLFYERSGGKFSTFQCEPFTF